MNRIKLDKDIQPLSEFRANAASCVKQINETGRPMILTQRGRSVAVVVDVKEYETMMEKLELLESIKTAESQIDTGDTYTTEQVEKELLGKIK